MLLFRNEGTEDASLTFFIYIVTKSEYKKTQSINDQVERTLVLMVHTRQQLMMLSNKLDKSSNKIQTAGTLVIFCVIM